ncbi:GntR family transcriptional regulator [Neorhizobium sp. NCHU2750]|uniref:GntR family transcriptional regulator n=1 Tax=Neorhizobium sp. NCHU2750 TaxID=1825976 RepID=UPI000E71953E|nr:GntR family transcriptional regulator [Neorhizobium sp. NCHU2750]
MAGKAGGASSGRSPRLYQRALQVMSSEIRSGGWHNATKLNETAVAARFGISRAPARQALVELEALGLVRKAEGRGYQVVAAMGSLSSGSPTVSSVADRQPEDMRLNFLASWELIYRQVELDIASRTSFAGWRVNEATLAKTFGVSRTVAREVVARLQQRGIVSKDEAGRWQAPALTATHIAQLYELRWTLEPLALVQALPRLPDGLLPQLMADLEQAIAAGEGADWEILDRIEQQLHSQLLGHCGNPPLMQAISLPQAILVAHHRLYQPKASGAPEEPFLLEHFKIFECLLVGKVGDAAQELASHLRISSERAIERIAGRARTLSLPDLPYLERLRDIDFS